MTRFARREAATVSLLLAAVLCGSSAAGAAVAPLRVVDLLGLPGIAQVRFGLPLSAVTAPGPEQVEVQVDGRVATPVLRPQDGGDVDLALVLDPALTDSERLAALAGAVDLVRDLPSTARVDVEGELVSRDRALSALPGLVSVSAQSGPELLQRLQAAAATVADAGSARHGVVLVVEHSRPPGAPGAALQGLPRNVVWQAVLVDAPGRTGGYDRVEDIVALTRGVAVHVPTADVVRGLDVVRDALVRQVVVSVPVDTSRPHEVSVRLAAELGGQRGVTTVSALAGTALPASARPRNGAAAGGPLAHGTASTPRAGVLAVLFVVALLGAAALVLADRRPGRRSAIRRLAPLAVAPVALLVLATLWWVPGHRAVAPRAVAPAVPVQDPVCGAPTDPAASDTPDPNSGAAAPDLSDVDPAAPGEVLPDQDLGPGDQVSPAVPSLGTFLPPDLPAC